MTDNVEQSSQTEGQEVDNLDDDIEVIHEEELHEDPNEPVESYQVFDDKVERVSEEPTEEPPVDTSAADEDIEKHKKHKKHKTLKTEFNKVQREKYQALNEIEMLRVENERLQKLAALTAESATYHNDKSIELKLAQARSAKVAAYETADTEGMLKADELFAEAMNAKAESDRWKSQQKYNKEQQAIRAQQEQWQYQQQQQYQQQAEPEAYMNEESETWVSNNPWCNPESTDYNDEIAQEVLEYSKLIDKKYARLGQEDKILSQQYFDEIDKFVAEHYSDNDDMGEHEAPAKRAAPPVKVPQPQARTNINMKPVRQNVAPVGKTVKQAAPSNPNRVVLSAKERDFVKTMGITEADYAKQKLQIDRSGRYGYEQNKR